ncbi:P1 family peptidase, partial [Bacillus paralicheniformis]
MFGNITDVPGVKVGHRENKEGITGCTVLLLRKDKTSILKQRRIRKSWMD